MAPFQQSGGLLKIRLLDFGVVPILEPEGILYAHPLWTQSSKFAHIELSPDGNRNAKGYYEGSMKYMLAWLLGVPGGLILLWFLFNHMH